MVNVSIKTRIKNHQRMPTREGRVAGMSPGCWHPQRTPYEEAVIARKIFGRRIDTREMEKNFPFESVHEGFSQPQTRTSISSSSMSTSLSNRLRLKIVTFPAYCPFNLRGRRANPSDSIAARTLRDKWVCRNFRWFDTASAGPP